MRYTTLDTQPTTGQFTAMWEFDGELWSATFKWVDGALFVYCETDGWMNLSANTSDPHAVPRRATSALYIVKE